ncbi:hydroxycarboxylic acid receptor 2-like, partial [Coregonus clupeaformis]|uniref:hydroxycarboxylic acid receptor 2-like n=1 Tax=Coregonus clupeaformis TaxID=59861 RepID=UPI001BE103CE
ALPIRSVSGGRHTASCPDYRAPTGPARQCSGPVDLHLPSEDLPLLLLLFCSARIACILRQRQLDKGKKVRRAIRVVGLIVAMFVLCFFPGIATGMVSLYIKQSRPWDCDSYQMAGELFSLSIGFTYLNSTLDPVIYCFSSSMFRNSLKSSINKLGLVEMRLSRRGSMASDG